MHTVIGTFIGTPVYSCPEQVIHPTRDIDTRADLYSLGVVLYEILTGVPPRTAQELDADTPAELARRLRDTKTPAMGTRYSGLRPEEQQRVAELRALSTNGLSMQLCSDLDWIVGKCIAQDPDDRYATVQDLRLDLQRWLDDRPVEARPATAWYRFRKMVRRNRLNSALIASGTLALLASTAVAINGFLRAERALAQANAAADFQASQITSISPASMGQGLQKALQAALKDGGTAAAPQDPSAALAAINMTEISTNQVVDYIIQPAIQSVEEEFTDHPLLQGRILESQAKALNSLGRYEAARSVISSAIAKEEKILGPTHPAVIEKATFRARLLTGMGKLRDAEFELRKVLDFAVEHAGADSHVAGMVMHYLCENRVAQEDISPDDLAICRNSVDILAALHGPLHEQALRARITLAGALQVHGDLAEAETIARAAMDSVDPKHEDVAWLAASFLSRIAADQYDFDKALTYEEKFLKFSNAHYGESHQSSLVALNNFALALLRKRNFADAAPLLEKNLERLILAYGKKHAFAVFGQQNLARALFGMGKLSESEAAFEAAIRTAEPDRQRAYWRDLAYYFSELLVFKGRQQDAQVLLREILAQSDAQAESVDYFTIASGALLALILAAEKNLPVARKHVELAQSRLEQLPRKGRRESDLGLHLEAVHGRILRQEGKLVDAENAFRNTLKKQLDALPTPHANDLFTARELSEALSAQGKHSEAVAVCTAGIARTTQAHHPRHPEWIQQLTQCGVAQLAAGRWIDAEAMLLEAWDKLSTSEAVMPEYRTAISQSLEKVYHALNSEHPQERYEAAARRWKDESKAG